MNNEETSEYFSVVNVRKLLDKRKRNEKIVVINQGWAFLVFNILVAIFYAPVESHMDSPAVAFLIVAFVTGLISSLILRFK